MRRGPWLGYPQCSHMWVPASTNGSPLIALGDPPTISSILPLFLSTNKGGSKKTLPFPSLQKGPKSHHRDSHQDRQSIEEVNDHAWVGWVQTGPAQGGIGMRTLHLQSEPGLLLVLTLDVFSCWRCSVTLGHTVLTSSEFVSSCLCLSQLSSYHLLSNPRPGQQRYYSMRKPDTCKPQYGHCPQFQSSGMEFNHPSKWMQHPRATCMQCAASGDQTLV